MSAKNPRPSAEPRPQPQPQPEPRPDDPSGRGCLPAIVRLVWIFGGIALIYVALFIAQGKGTALTALLMIVMTLALILVRFADIKFLGGETLDNKPATLKHWRRYAVMIAIVAAVLYAFAKFAAEKNLLR